MDQLIFSIKKRRSALPVLSRLLLLFAFLGCDSSTNPKRVESTTTTLSLHSFLVDQVESDQSILTQCLAWGEPHTLWQTSGGLESRLIKRSRFGVLETEWPLEGIFAEGCTQRGTELLVLSWRSFVMLVIDPMTGELIDLSSLQTEGWGLAHSEHGLVYSDGSSSLHWIELIKREDFTEANGTESTKNTLTTNILRTITVRDQGLPVFQVNELEWLEEYLLANIYPSNRVAVIEATSGQVIAWIDLSILVEEELSHQDLGAIEPGVPNGIAYDRNQDLLWFTGKNWRRIYAATASRLLQEIRSIKNR